jgi:hypothetical protein
LKACFLLIFTPMDNKVRVESWILTGEVTDFRAQNMSARLSCNTHYIEGKLGNEFSTPSSNAHELWRCFSYLMDALSSIIWQISRVQHRSNAIVPSSATNTAVAITQKSKPRILEVLEHSDINQPIAYQSGSSFIQSDSRAST